MNTAGNQIIELDGRTFYYSFLAGANSLMEHQQELNRINVFPVADADTGTNLASTIRSIIENVHPHKSFKKTIDDIANAALTGARGNSGVIFAQFFYGLSNETQSTGKINLKSFADILQNSVKYIYDALAEPVEGTMLTVIREWAGYIHNNRHKSSDFIGIFHDAYQVARQSLQETTGKLKVLAKSNVVDAGAKGFVVFLSGIIDLLHTKDIRKLFRPEARNIPVRAELSGLHDTFSFRYCTEAIVRGANIDRSRIRTILGNYGDSVVVAGAPEVIRLHVHTNEPAMLFDELRHFGTLSFQKAEDMQLQYETAHHRKYPIALVTDSTCDLPREILEKYQVHMVHLNLNFGENQYLDKLTIEPSQFYDLTDISDDFPSTSQPTRQSFVNLYSQLATHYESVIALHLTQKFSGTWQASRKAAEIVGSETGKKISVIDSKTLSGALGLLVLRTAQAIEQGMKHDDIVQSMDDWIAKSKIFVSVKTLDYMVRGGRVSPMKGKIARLLNLKPIISMDKNGGSVLLDKAFTQKGNMRLVLKHISGIVKGQHVRNYLMLHAHDPETAAWYEMEMETITGKKALATLDISPVIGLNAGKGAVAVSLIID